MMLEGVQPPELQESIRYSGTVPAHGYRCTGMSTFVEVTSGARSAPNCMNSSLGLARRMSLYDVALGGDGAHWKVNFFTVTLATRSAAPGSSLSWMVMVAVLSSGLGSVAPPIGSDSVTLNVSSGSASVSLVMGTITSFAVASPFSKLTRVVIAV